MALNTAAPASRTAEHRFFLWLSLAMLAATLAGFTRSYLLVPVLGLQKDTLPYTPLVHVHAVAAFGWCALFVAQCWLVATGRTPRHRQLGALGVVLYAALVLLGPPVAVGGAVRYGATDDELAFLAVGLFNVLGYATLLGLALLARRRPAWHKRWMVLGMVALLSAPFGRLLGLPYLLNHVAGPGLVVLALAWWDRRSLGALHPATRYGGPGILLWQLLPNAVMHTAAWQACARWLVGLGMP
jgi:hypothetical protein